MNGVPVPSDTTSDAGAPLSAGFVSPGWPPESFSNGIIPYVADVAAEMTGEGHRVAILAQNLGEGKSHDDGAIVVRDIRRGSAPRSFATRAVDSLIYRVSPRLGSSRLNERALLAGCRGLIAERGLQVVEIEESFGLSLSIQRKLPIPVVVRLHGPWFLNGPLQGVDVESEDYRERVRYEGEAIRKARAITAASRDVLERTRAYYGIPLPDARVIYNPTKLIPPEEHWDERSAKPDTILFVGRFDRHKGGDLMIDAFAKLAVDHPNARLRFVGTDNGLTGDDGRHWKIEPYLAHRLGDLATTGRVEWLGRQPGPSIAAIRREAAVVVVASRYDNFPMTVLEAMALGCPLVAARIGGIPEVVEDGSNGLLFEAGQSTDLAEKIRLLLDDRALAVRLGRQAAIDVDRKHGPRCIAGQVAGFFREVVGAATGPSDGRIGR